MLRWIRGAVPCCMVLLFTLWVQAPGRAQDQSGPPLPPSTAMPPGTTPGMDPLEHRLVLKMARERNVQRQKQLVDDANKLLDLARKLKTEVDKSDKDQLSLSVVDTAAQIEKLAKSVKERMRDGD